MKINFDDITLENYHIRSWQLTDEQALVKYANNKNIWINLRDRFPNPYTLVAARNWLKTATHQIPETNFVITYYDEAIGGIGFILQDDVYKKSAEIGYWLAEEFWHRGITTAAVKIITQYAI